MLNLGAPETVIASVTIGFDELELPYELGLYHGVMLLGDDEG